MIAYWIGQAAEWRQWMAGQGAVQMKSTCCASRRAGTTGSVLHLLSSCACVLLDSLHSCCSSILGCLGCSSRSICQGLSVGPLVGVGAANGENMVQDKVAKLSYLDGWISKLVGQHRAKVLNQAVAMHSRPTGCQQKLWPLDDKGSVQGLDLYCSCLHHKSQL